MRALTIRQPYAHLIMIGEKRVENRTWHTRYRGPLAIHAGKCRSSCVPADFEKLPDMAFGAVVAVATLTHCIPLRTISDGTASVLQRLPWLMTDVHTEGPWCWILEDVRRVGPPIPCPGRLQVWKLPEAIADQVGIAAQLSW